MTTITDNWILSLQIRESEVVKDTVDTPVYDCVLTTQYGDIDIGEH